MMRESGQNIEGGYEKKELPFYDKERARELVYSSFLLGKLEEKDAFELLNEIDAFDKALEKGIFKTLQEYSDQISESMEDIESGQWKDELDTVLARIHSLDLEDSGEIKYARSFVAHHLVKLMKKFQASGKSLSDFATAVREWMKSAEEIIPDSFEKPGQVVLNKRQPGFHESVEETLKRYEAIEKTKEALAGHVDGIIFGGSMSYGPFYNVRGDHDETGPSDLDGIVVLKEGGDEIPLDEIFDKEQADNFPSRMEEFRKLQSQGEANIITQKSGFRDQDFDISIHFFPPDEFEKMVGENFQASLKDNDDTAHIIKDYRSAAFSHPHFNSHNYDGSTYENDIPEPQAVNNGVINELPGFRIHDGKYYTGVYQNVISPGFDVWYDRTGDVTEQVKQFKNTMVERMKIEEKKGSDISFEKSHIRHKIFSPHFIEDINK